MKTNPRTLFLHLLGSYLYGLIISLQADIGCTGCPGSPGMVHQGLMAVDWPLSGEAG